MPRRNPPLANNEVYHIYLRGIKKQTVFFQPSDYARFLFNVLFFQSDSRPRNPGRYVKNFLDNGVFDQKRELSELVTAEREVSLIAFALMPNHFHLLIQQIEDAGISKYMMRVLNGYVKYFNGKYEDSGRLFQSEFKSTHISDNTQLLHTSAYIHRNPAELSEWDGLEDQYYWSSLQDYTKKNRWGSLLQSGIVLNQFKKGEYRKFIQTSPAKQ